MRLGPTLVADDDLDVLKAAAMALAGHADSIDAVSTPAALQARLVPGRFEVVLLDMNFQPGDHSGREGLAALDWIRSVDPDVAVVLMTAYGGVSLAVTALKRGAVEFVLKPWRNEKLIEAVAAAAALSRARRTAGASFDLAEVERETIGRALARYDHNIAQAAKALGLTRPALYRRMAKHGL